MIETKRPIELSIKPFESSRPNGFLRIFTSYSFDKNIMVPASAFRFTAEGVNAKDRLNIRSGDTVTLWSQISNKTFQLATGIIDETDTHVNKSSVGYVLTGRDLVGQLVDNAAVDKNNNIIHAQDITLEGLGRLIIQNTRLPQSIEMRNAPNGNLKLQTNPGETKLNTLQRYLEFCNCLVWTRSDGVLILGKPNMAQDPSALLTLKKNGSGNNVLEARVKRNVMGAIRQIAVQLQDLAIVNPTSITKYNNDNDIKKSALLGRSVMRMWSQGDALSAINQYSQVGNNGGVRSVGEGYALREMALDNVRILDVECVTKGHFDENNQPYDIDKVYTVVIEDEDVATPLYCYGVRYDFTKESGLTTTLRLCKTSAIVADVPSRVS